MVDMHVPLDFGHTERTANLLCEMHGISSGTATVAQAV